MRGGGVTIMYITKRALAATIIGTLVVSSGATAYTVKQYDQNRYAQIPPGADQPNQSAAFKKFYQAFSLLQTKYVNQETTQTLLDGAINGMVQSLDDPFTSYMDPKAASKFQSMVSSSFE